MTIPGWCKTERSTQRVGRGPDRVYKARPYLPSVSLMRLRSDSCRGQRCRAPRIIRSASPAPTSGRPAAATHRQQISKAIYRPPRGPRPGSGERPTHSLLHKRLSIFVHIFDQDL